MLKQIRPEEAAIGMYVQAFDGSWMAHPFWRARFLISTAEQLARIKAGGVGLTIDTSKGADVRPAKPKPQPATPTRPSGRFGKADKARAKELAERSTRVVRTLFDSNRLGTGIDAESILETVDDIAEEMNRNMSAFISVTRLKSKDDFTYTHSIAVCALMISLAREIGVPDKIARDFGMAGLLHDVGKVAISDDILLKADCLTDTESAEMRRHPMLGHEILSVSTSVPPVALDVCLHHHERPDGTGYPFGLKGDTLSRAVRIASICDVYEAMTSSRPYREGMTSLEAITAMDATDGQFDRDLLFKFMRSIDIYPAGKLVRLRGNRLAVALPMSHHGFGPVFRIFYSTTDGSFVPYENVILSERQAGDDAISADDPAAWFSADWPTMAAAVIEGKKMPALLRQSVLSL